MSTNASLNTSSISMNDIDLINNIFSIIDNAINNNNYEHAVEFASTTIDTFNEIESSLFFTALDHRSFAIGQIGKLDMAIQSMMRKKDQTYTYITKRL